MSVTVGLLALLNAKPGKEDELAAFLENGRALAVAEKKTVTWYAFRLSASRFGIFDTFESEEGRQAHLSGEVVKALTAATPNLLAGPPEIQQTDIIAVK